MPDPSPQTGVSDGCGVPVVRCEYADNTPASYWSPDAAERINFPIQIHGRWFEAAEAAALVDVAEAASSDYHRDHGSDALKSALNRLDAARYAS